MFLGASATVFGLGSRVLAVKWIGCGELVILNVDDAARENPGIAGAGGILRYANGAFIGAFASFLGLQITNSASEIETMITGIEYATGLGFARVQVQSISIFLCDSIKACKISAWRLDGLFQELLRLLGASTVQHIYREAKM